MECLSSDVSFPSSGKPAEKEAENLEELDGKRTNPSISTWAKLT